MHFSKPSRKAGPNPLLLENDTIVVGSRLEKLLISCLARAETGPSNTTTSSDGRRVWLEMLVKVSFSSSAVVWLYIDIKAEKFMGADTSRGSDQIELTLVGNSCHVL